MEAGKKVEKMTVLLVKILIELLKVMRILKRMKMWKENKELDQILDKKLINQVVLQEVKWRNQTQDQQPKKEYLDLLL